MFGSKGPRTRPGSAPRPPARGSGPSPGADETIILPGRRAGAPTPSRATPPEPPREFPSFAGGSASPSIRSGAAAAPARARLVDLAASWLATVLALARVKELPDAAVVRTRALELRARFEQEAQGGGFDGQDVQDALLALVAFLDETVLSVRGSARDAWLSRPLGLELFGRNDLGEVFFDRLDVLRAAREGRIEALEVYYACLMFGFSGRYRMSPPERLAQLTSEVGRDVSVVRGVSPTVLSPAAARPAERAGASLSGVPRWIPVAAAVSAVLLAFLIIFLANSVTGCSASGTIGRLAG